MNAVHPHIDRQPAARGFTLLEVIVTLVIGSMISAVLMQGFGMILTTRTRVAAKIVDVQQPLLRRNLILEPVRGLLPDYPEKPNVFHGEPRKMQGLTVLPIENRPGAPVGFTLMFDTDSRTGETLLIYQERGGKPLELARWEGPEGSFAYRDRSGPWRDSWPPRSNPDSPQTPFAIMVNLGFAFPRMLIASIAGPHERILRLQDSPLGGDLRPPSIPR